MSEFDDQIEVTPGPGPASYNVSSYYSKDVIAFSAGGLLAMGDWVEHHRGELMRQVNGLQETSEQENEHIVQSCLDELASRKLALIPPSVAQLIKQQHLNYTGSYEELSALVWKLRNDPETERAYKRIIASDRDTGEQEAL